MVAAPLKLTDAMKKQATTALNAVGNKKQPADIPIRELRAIVTKHYTKNATDAKDDHNIRAQALKAWFPGLEVLV